MTVVILVHYDKAFSRHDPYVDRHHAHIVNIYFWPTFSSKPNSVLTENDLLRGAHRTILTYV